MPMLPPSVSLAVQGEATLSHNRLVLAHHPLQQEAAREFIRHRFAQEHAARITHFMPQLYTLTAEDGTVQGAAGLRPAASDTLFLERYIDLPVEEAIAVASGLPVQRSQVVEVGNLAAAGLASGRRLIVELTRLLAAQGFGWVAFTGTRSLLNSFRRLRIELFPLAEADPARMGESIAEWGRYYDHQPQVMASPVQSTYEHLCQSGALVPDDGLNPAFLSASKVYRAA